METAQKKIVRSLLTVKRKVFVGPNYIRVIFGMSDEKIDQFRDVRRGDHNKIFIPAMGVSDINEIWNSDLFIARRTYTTRNIDVVNVDRFCRS
ncbi:NADPH-dependent ferric siderophore reductase [Chitinophaga sp. OAE865]